MYKIKKIKPCYKQGFIFIRGPFIFPDQPDQA